MILRRKGIRSRPQDLGLYPCLISEAVGTIRYLLCVNAEKSEDEIIYWCMELKLEGQTLSGAVNAITNEAPAEL
jgi:hypothetical protein